MRKIKQEIHLDAKPEEVYEAYTDAKKHAKFTGSKVIFENKVGGKFSAWDGGLEGENLELVAGRKIVQKWRADDWPKGHYSHLTIELFPEPSSPVILSEAKNLTSTRLVLTQVDVPDDKFDDINSGWHEYYWEPMEEHFKKGAK